MFLWLDDLRNPAEHGAIGAVWAKTYHEAIAFLDTGEVKVASLDHDLTVNQTIGLDDNEKTGYDVVKYMEEHDIWPEKVFVHSMNASGKIAMLQAIQRHYGKLFQPPFYI